MSNKHDLKGLLRRHNITESVSNATQSIENAVREERLKALGPMGRLMTMLQNPSVPDGVKVDLKSVDSSVRALSVLLDMISEQIPEITDALEVKHQTANAGEESLIAGRILSRWKQTAKFVEQLKPANGG